MKKITTLFLTLFVAYAAKSQVLLSEDFENGLPSSFTLYDEDGLTVSSNISSFFPNAWNALRYTGTTDNFAASTSSYTPAGQSDDWMVTPVLTLGDNMFLIWEGRSANSNNFESYEVLISTTGNAVVDFTTTIATVSSETVEWNKRSFNLSAYADSTVYIAFRNTSTAKYILGIDDIEVRSVDSLDVSVSEITTENLYVENDAVTVEGVIYNLGRTAITAVDLNYSVNGEPTVTQSLTGLNIAPFSTSTFSMNSTFSASNPGDFTDLKVWVSNPNGGVDAEVTNDTLSKEIFVNKGLTVTRNVLFEEFTTAVCQFCPNGAVVTDYIKSNIANSIIVGVHSCFYTDAMTNSDASTLCSTIGSNSAPSGMVDRVLFDNESYPAFGTGTNPLTSPWTTRTQTRSGVGSPLTVEFEGLYKSSTREANVTIKSNFIDYPLPGDIRVSLIITEDSVTGSGSGYNQVNAYNNTPGHAYYNKGNPIVGFVHRHVMREILPSTFGDNTVIPSSIALNTDYDKNFSFTLSNSYDVEQVHLVAVVSYSGPGLDEYEVLNAKEIKLTDLISVGINEKSISNASLEVYPNPSKNIANVSIDLIKNERVQLEIQDITGKVIVSEDHGVMSKGNQLLRLNVSNLANGLYFLNLKVGNEIVTKKMTVAK